MGDQPSEAFVFVPLPRFMIHVCNWASSTVCHAELAELGLQSVFHDAFYMYASCTRVEGLWASASQRFLLCNTAPWSSYK